MSAQNRYDPAERVTSPPTRSLLLLIGGSLLLSAALAAVPRDQPGLATIGIVGGAWVAMVLAVTLPSREARAGADLARRLGRFRDAVTASGDEPARADLEQLLALAASLNLGDEQIADDVARIRASLAAVTLEESLAHGALPTVPATGLAPGDVCHFSAAVRCGRRRADQFGHVLMTGGWLKFRGATDLSVAWSEVAAVQRDDDELIVALTDTHRMLRFACQSAEQAARGGVIARYLVRLAHAADPVTTAGARNCEPPATALPA